MVYHSLGWPLLMAMQFRTISAVDCGKAKELHSKRLMLLAKSPQRVAMEDPGIVAGLQGTSELDQGVRHNCTNLVLTSIGGQSRVADV